MADNPSSTPKKSSTVREKIIMGIKSTIRSKTVWTTSDNVQHTTEMAAKEHERGLIIKSLLTKDKEIKNAVDKGDLHLVVNRHIDTIIDAIYEKGLLTSGYGTREDF